MRPALNGIMDGLPFKGRLLVPTRAWILTSTSLVMRRLKSPFLQTALESQTLLLRPAPLLLTSELPYINLLVFFFFFTLGFDLGIYVLSFSMNTPFSISLLLSLFFFFITAPLVLLCLSYLGSMAIWPCLS